MSIVDLLTKAKHMPDIDCTVVTLLSIDLIIARLASIDRIVVTLPSFAKL